MHTYRPLNFFVRFLYTSAVNSLASSHSLLLSFSLALFRLIIPLAILLIMFLCFFLLLSSQSLFIFTVFVVLCVIRLNIYSTMMTQLPMAIFSKKVHFSRTLTHNIINTTFAIGYSSCVLHLFV